MAPSFYIRYVANVVHSWMSYIYEVSETKHFAAESSLRYPIAGLLERKKDISLFMEEDHPIFSDARIDFMWKNDQKKIYLELKYIRDISINVQEIFDDIFRLAFIQEGHAQAYFLMCGESANFIKRIQRRTRIVNKPVVKKNGKINVEQSGKKRAFLFRKIFSFDPCNRTNRRPGYKNIKEFEFKADDNAYYKYYSTFKDTYSNKCKLKMQFPDCLKIKTTLVQPINKGLRSAVAIWKIEKI